MGKLKAGSNAMFANSLAEGIEQRLDALLRADGLPGLPNGPESEVRRRRHLFIAIAQAVIDHLSANPDAFVVRASPRRTLAAIEQE